MKPKTIRLGNCAASYMEVEVIEGHVVCTLNADDFRWLLIADIFNGNAIRVPERKSERAEAAGLLMELANECDEYCEGARPMETDDSSFYAHARRSFGAASAKMFALSK